MFVLGNLLQALATILEYSLNIYMIILIARAVISWVSPDPYNPIVRFLYSVTEPVLYPIRRTLRLHSYAVDFSPLIAFFVIIFIKLFVVQTLLRLALTLKT